MATWRQKLVMRWRSIDGWRSSAFCTTQSNPDPGLGSLADVPMAIQACSVAGLMLIERQPVLVVNEAPEAGAYASIRDRAQIELRAADGSTGRIVIPAPIPEIFLSGGVKIDFSNGLVDAVVGAALANLAAQSGSPWVTATSGKRVRFDNI